MVDFDVRYDSRRVGGFTVSDKSLFLGHLDIVIQITALHRYTRLGT